MSRYPDYRREVEILDLCVMASYFKILAIGTHFCAEHKLHRTCCRPAARAVFVTFGQESLGLDGAPLASQGSKDPAVTAPILSIRHGECGLRGSSVQRPAVRRAHALRFPRAPWALLSNQRATLSPTSCLALEVPECLGPATGD